MYSLQRISPFIITFLLFPLIFVIHPEPLTRLYQIATFKMPQEEDHQSHHHHDHEDDAAFTEKNRKHWDAMATSYDVEQWQKDFLNAIHSFLLENISWIGVDFIDPSSSFEKNSKPEKAVRVLDYACGPGTITNILYSHANEFVGVDLSEAMVTAYNKRFNHTLPGEVAQTNAKAVVGNLIDPKEAKSVPEAEKESFDLVAVGMGFHHFSNLKIATERLTAYLRPGGVFLIVDFLTHSKESTDQTNPARHTVAHLGFGEKEVNELFAGAGLADVQVKVMKEEVVMRETMKRTVFVARGVKT
jgi:SAM-dependent methyltransferase